MSTWLPDGTTEWGGRPVARRVADASPRGRIVVTGTIHQGSNRRVGGTASSYLLLDDGSGRMGLLFVGRQKVPGLTTGARCTVEGTVTMKGGRPVIWNPLYRLEPADG